MATTTPIPMPNPAHELYPNPAPHMGKDIDGPHDHRIPRLDRSSSLSDIGERADERNAPSEPTIDSDPNDTEAETERLDDSPQKSRRNQNLVLTTLNSRYSTSHDPLSHVDSTDTQAAGSDKQVFGTASNRGSSVEGENTMHKDQSPRKRKRSGDEEYYLDRRRGSATGSEINMGSPSRAPKHASHPTIEAETWDKSREGSLAESRTSEEETQDTQEKLKPQGRRGKRRAGKTSDNEAESRSPSVMSMNDGAELATHPDNQNNNLDDAEIEDHGESADYESTVRDEESTTKKKLALESLGAIEKCFASLRDKLFDERLSKFNTELAMLAEPTVKHPELLGMMEALERRRQEKIRYENTLLKYKLGALQNKSKAEKAQIHGQYMQSVRESRERNLEQANKEWYQIHKERRSREDDVPEYSYQFPTRRSQQIIHQTAINKEVSLLSGIAKYRGFPAAPEIRGATPGEIDADLEKMGIVPQPAASLTRPPPLLRANLSAQAGLQRPKSTAEEHFLEQNPWANPQHPAHLHRQASALSRTASPFATPLLTKQPSEANLASVPKSTAAEKRNRPKLSAALMSHANHQITDDNAVEQRIDAGVAHAPQAATASIPPSVPSESLTPHSDMQVRQAMRNKLSPFVTSEKTKPLHTGRNQGSEIHVRPYIPKAMHRTESPGSVAASKIPPSPSSRLPIIKAEDNPYLSVRSPTSQHYQRPVSVEVTANGIGDRFGAS
ncbi:MAG: hypothetical protein Q9220_003261 [cf. Caloplaca sp. 1 TL-2023]